MAVIEFVIEQRRKDLGGFEVGRVLPAAQRRMVGPFVFFDHMGPTDFPPGISVRRDVRPHPHIGLSTVTYCSTGRSCTATASAPSAHPPGEVNWMTAGRGITHSERFERARAQGGRCTASRRGSRCRARRRRPSRLSPITLRPICRPMRAAACGHG